LPFEYDPEATIMFQKYLDEVLPTGQTKVFTWCAVTFFIKPSVLKLEKMLIFLDQTNGKKAFFRDT
jgi:hypothetical protein